MTKTVVLYHARCPDGFTAAWAAWTVLGDKAEYIPCNFDDAEVPDVAGRDVYIVDFSYPRDVLLDMKAKANSLLVLDHHKTAEANLDGIEGCHFDMNRSGAGMSWDHFHPGEERSPLVNYVEDRDLWRFALPDSKEVNSAITSYEFSFGTWNDLDRILRGAPEIVVGEGTALLRKKRAYVKSMIDTGARRVSFLGYDDIPIVNAPHISISELVGELAEGAPFAAGWRQVSDGKFVYSLRSRGDGLDVSEIASVLGGGGHKGAAGFHSDSPPWELDVDVSKALADRKRCVPDMGDDIARAIASVPPNGDTK